MTGPDPRHPDEGDLNLAEIATSWHVALSAFYHSSLYVVAMDGPGLRIVAWNELARSLLEPIYGQLGASFLDSEWIIATGFDDKLRSVYETGEPFKALEWTWTVPDEAGAAHDVVFDFTYTPWRRPDGSIRGVLTFATDVTEQVNRRGAAQEASQLWQERFQTSRDAMMALQASMLPGSVPMLPGIQVGARYLVSQADTAAGGDWFSAVVVPDGRLAVAVGDVVGHGVTASATMGQLQAVLEEHLRAGDGLADALRALDAFAEAHPRAHAATVCAAMLEPGSGALEYCTAGHPPSLIVEGERWRYAELTGNGPLGCGGSFTVATDTVADEGLLFRYSDGLVERPGRSLEASTVEIGQVVSHALRGRPVRAGSSTYDADRVCELAVHVLTRETGITDDVTVLAVRRSPLPRHLDISAVSGQAGALATLADKLDRWLADIHASRQDAQSIRHAAMEVITNSSEHAPREPGAPVGIRLTATVAADGVAIVTVSDTGQWRPALQVRSRDSSGPLRGLGLAMVSQLVDDWTVRSSPQGTTVTLFRQLRRPAPILSDPVASRPPLTPSAGHELATFVSPQRPHRLMVHGPVVESTVEQLRGIIAIESRGFTQDVTVDLNGVTHLASAGVHTLQLARRDAVKGGVRLNLIAAPGTVADQIMGLVGLRPKGG